MGQEFVGAKLSGMKKLYRSLDATFLGRLPNNSLFRLLNIEDADLLVPFIKSVLEYYDPDLNIFTIEGHTLGVTLQDVLYLTGLPVQGKAVMIPDVPDRDAFERVFGPNFKDISELSFVKLSDIAVNSTNDPKRRQIAVLATIFGAFIAPNSNQHSITSACIQFLEDVDQVDTYAWGAALLSYMCHGTTKNTARGNLWVLLGFFLIRFRKLQTLLGVSLENCPQPQREGAPLLPWILKEIQKKTRDHYMKLTIEKLLPLSEEGNDIEWRPYTMQCSRPDDLHCVRDITPMFCLNFVQHHMPHLCYRQFEEFERYDVNSVTWNYYKMPFKNRKGGLVQKFSKLYSQQKQEWDGRRPAESYMTSSILLLSAMEPKII